MYIANMFWQLYWGGDTIMILQNSEVHSFNYCQSVRGHVTHIIATLA